MCIRDRGEGRLLRQNLGGRHEGGLKTAVARGGDGVERDGGLAAAHIALEQPHHGARRGHVGQDGVHRAPLRRLIPVAGRSGIATIKAFSAEERDAQRVEADSEGYRTANRDAIRLSTAFRPLIRPAVLSGFMMTLIVGGRAALRGDLAPLLPAFGLIGAEFLTALAQVLDRAAHYQDDLGAHHRSTAAATDSGVEGYARTDSGAAPRVARAAPKLVASISRAISLCESTLTFGKAEEPPPTLKRFMLAGLVDEVIESAKLAPGPQPVEFVTDVDPSLTLRADREHPPDFEAPGNIVFMTVDRTTGEPVTDGAANAFSEAFLSGTQPLASPRE